jgi:hypothetical protein
MGPVRTGFVSAAILALPDRCYRCGALTRSIVGVLVAPNLVDDPEGFVEFNTVARAIVASIGAAELARHGIGRIKVRRSRNAPAGYLSNGCIACDAIQGSFPLREDLSEFVAFGGSYDDLVIAHATLPTSAVVTA